MVRLIRVFNLMAIVSFAVFAYATTKEDDALKRLAALNISFAADRFVQFSAQGDFAVVMAFLDAGMNADSSEPLRGSTPLINAAANGHVGIAKVILNAGAVVDKPDAFGCTALTSAAYAGRVVMVRLLLDAGANARAHSARCVPPLIAGIMSGKDEVVAMLLSANANPMATAPNGEIAVVAAAYGGKTDIVKRLLETRHSPDQIRKAKVAAEIAGHIALAKLIDSLVPHG